MVKLVIDSKLMEEAYFPDTSRARKLTQESWTWWKVTGQKRIFSMAEDRIDQIWHRPKKKIRKIQNLHRKSLIPIGKKFYQINMKTEKKETHFITLLKKS